MNSKGGPHGCCYHGNTDSLTHCTAVEPLKHPRCYGTGGVPSLVAMEKQKKDVHVIKSSDDYIIGMLELFPDCLYPCHRRVNSNLAMPYQQSINVVCTQSRLCLAALEKLWEAIALEKGPP